MERKPLANFVKHRIIFLKYRKQQKHAVYLEEELLLNIQLTMCFQYEFSLETNLLICNTNIHKYPDKQEPLTNTNPNHATIYTLITCYC